jgi:hypothetical protein
MVKDLNDMSKIVRKSSATAQPEQPKPGEQMELFPESVDDRPVFDREEVYEVIKKVGGKWQVQSHKGRSLGTYDSEAAAKKRLGQVEYFKHKNEDRVAHEIYCPSCDKMQPMSKFTDVSDPDKIRCKDCGANPNEELEDVEEGLEQYVTPGPTQIWYWKDQYSRDMLMGSDWLKKHNTMPDPKNLEKTHVLLGTIDSKDLDDIYHKMQGEMWSPRGEARELIRGKGLTHTSMSVGDVVVVDGKPVMVDWRGFYDLVSGKGDVEESKVAESSKWDLADEIEVTMPGEGRFRGYIEHKTGPNKYEGSYRDRNMNLKDYEWSGDFLDRYATITKQREEPLELEEKKMLGQGTTSADKTGQPANLAAAKKVMNKSAAKHSVSEAGVMRAVSYHFGKFSNADDVIDADTFAGMEQLDDRDLLGISIRPEDKGKKFYAYPEDIERTEAEGTGVKWAFAISESKMSDAESKIIKNMYDELTHPTNDAEMMSEEEAIKTISVASRKTPKAVLKVLGKLKEALEKKVRSVKVKDLKVGQVMDLYGEAYKIIEIDHDPEYEEYDIYFDSGERVDLKGNDKISIQVKEDVQMIKPVADEKIEQFLADNWDQFLNDEDAVNNLVKVFKITDDKAKNFVSSTSKGKGTISLQYAIEKKLAELRIEKDKLSENYGKDCIRFSKQIKELKEALAFAKEADSFKSVELKSLAEKLEKEAKEKISLKEQIAKLEKDKGKLNESIKEGSSKLKSTVNELKEAHKKEIVKTYFETKIKCMGLKLTERRLTLLGSCKTTEEVDATIREFQNAITEGALQFSGVSELKVSVTQEAVDPKQADIDRKVGSAMSAWVGTKQK